MVLTQCKGPIHSLTASSGMVGSLGFRRIHSLRTLTARADLPAAISDKASWYHKWNSSKANFMALSKHWRHCRQEMFQWCWFFTSSVTCLVVLLLQSQLDFNNTLACFGKWMWMLQAFHRSITHLWQHLILPPPAQSYSQQVVHHRGRLQADDTIVIVFRNPAEDSITVSLEHTKTVYS